MKRIFAILLILPLCVSLSSAQGFKKLIDKAEKKIKEGGTSLSQEEVGNGLKEALDKGVGKAVDFLSAEDGYYKSPYKILIPEEARKVTGKLKSVPGFQDVEKNLEEKLNRAAEDAAIKAKPIFIAAIKQMTFKDAMNILMGNKDAATRYLESSTYDNLFGEFMPVIQASLDKVNAREYWRSAVKAHNKLPFVKKANPELDEYVTQKALVGMFSLVEKKELDIRENTGSRNTDLLKKVFAKQD
ncbi:MAG: DUF4197 domain-containing protein [Bacteroidota bacterium]